MMSSQKAATPHTYRLFHYWRSSSSWRVRAALEHKKQSYEPIAVGLLDGESDSPEHLARNPAGAVPVLETPTGELLTESLAIIAYLDEQHPEAALLPSDAIARAKVRALAEVVNAGIQPIQNLPVMDFYSSDPEKRKQWNQHWIQNGLEVYEALCTPVAGTFSFSNSLTLADLCLAPQCYNAIRYDVSLDLFPLIKKIYANCLEHPSVAKSHPDHFKPKEMP